MRSGVARGPIVPFVKEGGELVLKVAIRHELFSQVRADRRLCDMGANTFTRRAERYAVGTSSRKDRPHGLTAVVLADDLIADLIAGLPDDDATDATPEASNDADVLHPKKAGDMPPGG